MIEVVPKLPVETLSYSAINQYLRCPEKFRRMYIERLWEPRYSYRVLGSAVDTTFRKNWTQKIDTEVDLPEDDIEDAYADSWKEALDEGDVVWREKPETVRETGRRIVKTYQRDLAPEVQPVAVNERLEMQYEGAEWRFVGVMDVRTNHKTTIDVKTGEKPLQAMDLEGVQPDSYMVLSAANGLEVDAFEFHQVRALKTLSDTRVYSIVRSAERLENFQIRLLMIAKEIAWRAENDHWQGAAPGAWWCAQKMCGFWSSCPMGGKS